MAKRFLLKKNNEAVGNLTAEIPENGIVSVGSDASSVLCLEDGAVAPEQFIIICESGKLMLLNRAAGTILNEQPLAPGALQEINESDEIRAGSFSLTPETSGVFIFPAAETNDFKIPETRENDPEESANIHITMNDVLENLRSDEKFYFLIEDAHDEKRRVYVESEEMWLGWQADGSCVVSYFPADIQTPRAQIRKDWSGVVLYPNQPQTVWVNDEILTEPRRLKNEDRLLLQMPNENRRAADTRIKFHEPTALLVLDSILPKELPPPISLPRRSANKNGQAKTNGKPQNLPVKNPPPMLVEDQSHRVFGYFSWLEIMIMAVGTLITAAMIFLVLEIF